MKIPKPVIFIVLTLLLATVAGVAFLWGQGVIELPFGKKGDKSVSSLGPIIEEEEIGEISTTKWEDPAGFAFDYNQEFKIDDNPDDEINYANLDMTTEDKDGVINITVNDTEYEDVQEWVDEDDAVSGGSVLDTEIGGLQGKKVVLPGSSGEIISAIIDADQVIYLISLKTSDEEKYWQKNYETILSSFEMVPFEGEEEDSARFLEIETGTGEDFGGEDAVWLEEEVIQ